MIYYKSFPETGGHIHPQGGDSQPYPLAIPMRALFACSKIFQKFFSKKPKKSDSHGFVPISETLEVAKPKPPPKPKKNPKTRFGK